MKISIKITADNAAFEDYPAAEVMRILRELADHVNRRGGLSPGDSLVLRDINGNRVGEMRVTR